MAHLISGKVGGKVNSKRIRRLMKENGLLSVVRRRKWSEEVYAKRRELKASIPPDLIRQNFFSSVPRAKMVEDITYLPGLEKTMYLNAIEDLYNATMSYL